VDVTALQSAGKDHSQPLAELMPGVLTGLGLDRRRAEAEIIKVWNSLIDPRVTAHAQPAGMNKGTLFVTVDNSAWLDEIVRYRRREILDRLQHSFGKETVKRISFRVG
jgi:predicted nucleic acid-binding Zn ribbon protein